MEHDLMAYVKEEKGGSSSRLKLTRGPKVVPTEGICIYMASKEHITLRGQKVIDKTKDKEEILLLITVQTISHVVLGLPVSIEPP
jgi:hypothetical protein